MRISKFVFSISMLFIVSVFASCGSNNNAAHSETKISSEAKTEAAPATKAVVYDCPMKCEGAKSDKPGKCPKCNMDLEIVK